MTQERDHSPIHPGEILAEDILAEFDLDAMHMAKSLGLPVHHVSQLLQGRRGIDADIAQRLARWLGTSADMWLGLQKTYDLEVAAQTIGDDVRRTAVLREKALAPQVALSADTTLP